MADIITWALGMISTGLTSATGASAALLVLIALFVESILLWASKASLPVSALIIVVSLGIMSFTINGGGDPVLGGAADKGVPWMLYMLVLALTGFLIYHFLFKRSNMG